MLVIPELKIIFIIPMKVAGQSFQHALLTYIGDENPRKRIQTHTRVSQVKGILSDKIWNNYLKVSIVRCPYDTMISMYYWVHHHKGRVGNFNIFALRSWQCVKNYQSFCIKNHSVVDFIIRYENIYEDIRELERKLGVSEGGILEPFKHFPYHTKERPQGQDVCKVYSKYPLARAIIDERMDAIMDNELVARYYPIYKERLSKQIPPLGYFTIKTASLIYNFRIKQNGYLHKLYRLPRYFPKRKDRKLV